MSVVAGVILAGGRGKRLGGVTKANLKVGGVSLLRRAASGMSALEGPLLISTGHIPASQIGSDVGWHIVPDTAKDNLGPLAGIAAAVEFLSHDNCSADFLMSLAVDTPFFPQDFCQRAAKMMREDVDVVVATHNNQHYPTNALWRLASIALLPEQLEEFSAGGIKKLIGSMTSAAIDLSTADGGNPCQNVNSMADLIACGRRHNMMRSQTTLPLDKSGLGKAKQNG